MNYHSQAYPTSKILGWSSPLRVIACQWIAGADSALGRTNGVRELHIAFEQIYGHEGNGKQKAESAELKA